MEQRKLLDGCGRQSLIEAAAEEPRALVEEAVAGRDGLSPEMAISEFYVWFQPLIKQWMYLARSNGETWIKRAVEHDGYTHHYEGEAGAERKVRTSWIYHR